ncbi:hypothetical protein SAMN05444165_0626 [Paraburkholderia phenazinium]|jgi:hypothetical protein|uniref:Uncharacterized protein n=1 Tax=Paraburkholderia phenazinium TaxID=60549 RepID=A0A1N6G8M3_9BURK|nr:hypothetical protein SAMN05444165_0626 [Paraburkholderia phenazinium]
MVKFFENFVARKLLRILAVAAAIGIVGAPKTSLAACTLPGCEGAVSQDPGAQLNRIYDSSDSESLKSHSNAYSRSASSPDELATLSAVGAEAANPYAVVVGRMGYERSSTYSGLGAVSNLSRSGGMRAGVGSSTSSALPNVSGLSTQMQGARSGGNW